MKTAGVILAVALAVALQTTLARFMVRGAVAVDLVLVSVVYVALMWGPGPGLMAGTLAGLVQDAPGGTGLPALLGSLRSLRELCSARAHLYARVADLLGRQEALWSPEEKGGA